MFMVRMFHTMNSLKLVTKVFLSLSDAEDFCDYHFNCGWTIWELAKVDTTLSDMFCTDRV